MKTKLAAMLTAAALLLPLKVGAQIAPHTPGPQGRTALRRGQAIRDVLDLTDRQFAELGDLRDSHNKQLADLASQLRDLEKQRRDAMAASDNPALVGSIALQIQQVQQQVEQENKSYHEQALTILDAGQREKVEQIQEALKLAPSAGALMQFGLLDTSELPGGGPRGVFLGGPAGRMMARPGGGRTPTRPPSK